VVAGAGIGATLSIWIPDTLIRNIIASALGVSGGLIAWNNEGDGVIIYGVYTLIPSVNFYWIKSQ
jgi:hypothetical protein